MDKHATVTEGMVRREGSKDAEITSTLYIHTKKSSGKLLSDRDALFWMIIYIAL